MALIQTIYGDYMEIHIRYISNEDAEKLIKIIQNINCEWRIEDE